MPSSEQAAGGGSDGTGQPSGTPSKKSSWRGSRGAQSHAPKKPDRVKVKHEKFEGRIDGLEDHIYDVSSYALVNDYSRTTKEIAEYVARELHGCGSEIATGMVDGVEPAIPMPPTPDDSDWTAQMRYKMSLDDYSKEMRYLKEGRKKAYAFVWGQCSDAMRAKLEAMTGHGTVNLNKDLYGLLANIKDVSLGFQSQKHPFQTVHEIKRKFFALKQLPHHSAQKHRDRFKLHVDAVEHCGGSIVEDSMFDAMMAERGYTDVQRVDAVAAAEIEKAARDRYMGIALLLSADRNRFAPMIRTMENNYLTGIDQYPKTFDKAFGILLNWQAEHEASVGNYKSDGLAFATIDEEGVKRKKDGSVLKCFDCDGNHFRGDESCPKFDKSKKTEETGSTFLNAGFTEDDFSDGGEYETFVFVCDDDVGPDGKVDPHYILLDNQSTVDVFYNEQMLKNIHESGATINIHTNAGSSRTSLQGHLPGYGDVW